MSPFTILKRSALSEGTKKSTIFQEGLRRLSHAATWLPWEQSVKHLTDWANTLRISGYSEKERFDSIHGAVTRHDEMKRLVSAGEISSLHRSRDEILKSKAKKSGILSSTCINFLLY